MKSKVGIVTVLYNSSSVLPDFFRSLDRQECRDFTLYVVDNASPDDSQEQAKRLATTVSFQTVFIENTCNGGIAQGNNLGIVAARQTGCEWILLSNNDTVWQPDTLKTLLEETDRCDAEIAVPKIKVHDSDRNWYAGGGWNRWRGGTKHIFQEKPQDLKFRVVEYASTCCMLIRRAVFDRIGGMDERFFLYYDDSDFVRRAADAGIKIGYVPQATISHKESVSTGAVSPLAQYWLSRNLLLFTHKHHSKVYWYYVLAVNLLILFTKRLLTFRPAEWQASWRGTCDGIRACRKLRPEPILKKAWKG